LLLPYVNGTGQVAGTATRSPRCRAAVRCAVRGASLAEGCSRP